MKKVLKVVCIVVGVLTGGLVLYCLLSPKKVEVSQEEDDDFDSDFIDEDIENED